MSWIIGKWRILKEGEIHQVIKKCINVLLKDEWDVNVCLKTETRKLGYGRELYELLRDYEKSHGISNLLELLIDGLRLEFKKDDTKIIEMAILLRTPSDSQDSQELFKDIVVSWIEENPLSFSERFFRLPKISEDIADRYLDNPLEKLLKRKFGFHFQYKLIIQSKDDNRSGLELLIRKKLYQICAG